MMTSLKMWCLLLLTIVLFLSITPTVTEVVQSMSKCEEFLLNKTSPHIPDVLEGGNIKDQNRFKVICQTYKDKRRFVTLYDTRNKIPVFSAYKYEGDSKEEKKRPKTPWKIEPQLEERDSLMNMWDDKYKNQAGNYDYKNQTEYNRGHLFPSSYAFDQSDKISTFTLTNAVPQNVAFNGGSWQRMESCVKCILQKYCINNNGKIEAYVVTGAMSSEDKKLNNKVNIPSVLWSAFCCYNKNENKWLGSAHWGENTKENAKDDLPTKTLKELHDKLKIEAFPKGKCQDIPKLDKKDKSKGKDNGKDITKNCQCPP